MDLKSAITRLTDAAHRGTGASAGAATVLLFAWNSAHPIRGLASLDTSNRIAALKVLQAVLIGNRSDCEREVERIAGYDDLQALIREYGVCGKAWS